MSSLPKIPANHAQERRGVLAVAKAAIEMGQIWRETPMVDVGIDGQLEYVDPRGHATGQMLAVQVKSGQSFFEHEEASCFKHYIADKHRAYWERFPLPVILILHHPSFGRSHWVDARQVLRTPSSAQLPFVRVPKKNVLETTPSTLLFENAGVQAEAYITDLDEVIKHLVGKRSTEGTFPLSFFDLFVLGLTNFHRSVYFGIDLALTTAESNMALSGSDKFVGVGVGAPEHQFLFDYVRFLVGQHLAAVDFADCLVDWIDREVHPHFVAPLTSRGRQLAARISELEDHFVSSGVLQDDGNLRIAQDGVFEMAPGSYFVRIPRISEFGKLVASRRHLESDSIA